MLLVESQSGALEGIITKTDILRSLQAGRPRVTHRREDAA
jgi:hypothetical protein